MDFVTTPGYLTGPGARESFGLPEDTGPYKVITNLAVLGFDERTRQMQIESLHPGVSLDEVRDHTGFELRIPESIETTPDPSSQQLEILRHQVDPLRYIIGRSG